MKLDDDLLFADDLPADARSLIEETERIVDTVRRQSERAVSILREQAEKECQLVRARMEAEVAATEAATANELTPVLRTLFTRLKGLQNSYAVAGQLDEALAIRARLRGIRCDLFGVRPDPGNLTEYGPADIGKALIFVVTGNTEGNIWGTDVFTADSRLALAAVFTGALRVGESGLVRVTLIDGTERVYDGSERNGIRSLDYGNYSIGYQVERI